MDSGADRLDLRLVPAALTCWAVTAAGILWHVTGLVAAAITAVVLTAAAGWLGDGRRGVDVDRAAIRAG
ncbi:hypothetical protein AAV95_23665, partial [Mycolicibacterium elephantis]